MSTLDLIRAAVSNTFRSKTRSLLTILAIFVGAFTLTLTGGLGTGINAYIDDTVTGVGAPNAITVTAPTDGAAFPGAPSTTPQEYDPEVLSGRTAGMKVTALTPDDISAIGEVAGVREVKANQRIDPDYIQFDGGAQFVASVGTLMPGQTTMLASGEEPDDDSAELQVALPISYIEPLGFDSASSAVGQTVTIGITDAARGQHTLDAAVIGITEDALISPAGPSILLNGAASDALFDAQSTGLSAEEIERFASATAWFDDDATGAEVDALKERLSDAGYVGTTTEDQLGTITTVIDGIVLVLNAFAIIALLAAAFGIVNTLYMSVQERTREIGLMKAMGMGSGRIFSLFSLEAAFLGFLGSALGAGIAVIVGVSVSGALATSLLADLPGLSLIAFDPLTVAGVIALVVGIAFLAGTLPAARAARADPVESLRYE